MMLKKSFCGLFILAILSGSGLTARSATLTSPPVPARIGGTVKVDGLLLTQEKDCGYTITVTKPDGSKYDPPAQDTDGLNHFNYFNINIPMWDPSDQPGGAHPGESAVIHVYKDGSELSVTSPINGRLTVREGGSVTPFSLEVQTRQTIVNVPLEPRIVQRVTMEDIAAAPVNLGSVATGGNSMGLSVNFPVFAGPVDIWVAVRLPGGTIFFLNSGNTLSVDQAPFKVGVTQASVGTIVEEFEICSLSGREELPEGTWTVYWLVAPTNGGRIDLIDFDNGAYELDSYRFDLRCKDTGR